MSKKTFDMSSGLNKKIKIALMSLSAQKPFATFDIKLFPDEKDSLEKIRIDYTKAYDNFGNLKILTSEVKEFIQSLGRNNIEYSRSLANLVTKLANEVVWTFEKETAWITLRSFITTNSYDLPRWHSDGYYYSPYLGEQYKIAITLKGPSSLFYPLPSESREKFNSLQYNPENREILAKMLDASHAVSIPFESGAVYIVGSNNAAIHSEPPIHEERLFLSIVPGSVTEIQELYNNWHPK